MTLADHAPTSSVQTLPSTILLVTVEPAAPATPLRGSLEGLGAFGVEVTAIEAGDRDALVERAAVADLVHAVGADAWVAVATALPDTPFVVSPAEDAAGPAAMAAAARARRPGSRLRRARRIVCGGEGERSAFVRRHPWAADRTAVVHPAVEPISDATPPVSEQRRVALHVGPIEPGRGIETLAAAAEHLPSDALMALVGDGTLRITLERSPAVADGRLRLLGPLEDEICARWLRTATVYVDLQEDAPVDPALLQAASAGARVIASDSADHRGLVTRLAAGATSLVTADVAPMTLAQAVDATLALPRIAAPAALPTAAQLLDVYADALEAL